MRGTLKERLYAKLPERPGDGCWIFTGSTDTGGYGRLYTHSVGRTVFLDGAHRISYELHIGPIPDGAHVLHRCDVKPCCNPAHLFLGDHAANMRDMSKKGRAKAGPVADPAWWTPERRAVLAKATGERGRAARRRKQARAGVSTDTKFCPTCRRWQPLDAFGRNRARFDGVKPHCKACSNASEIVRRRRKSGQTDKPRRATRSDKKHFIAPP
jgi:hypothetical protein